MKKVLFLLLVLISVNLAGQESDDYNYQYALTEAARQKVIGNLKEAIMLYKKCVETKPEESVAYYELGSIYGALKEPALAEDYLKKAYDRDPENYWYVLAYDQILKQNEKFHESVKVCRKFLNVNNDSRVLFNIAESLESMGKYNKALKSLRKIEKEKGLSETVALKKVDIYKKKGEYEKGKQVLLTLRDQVPESPGYNILIAEYLEETGNMQEAVDYYKTAFDLDSTNVYAISNLADYYNKDGFSKKGYFYLEKAFALPQIKPEKKMNTLMFFLRNDSLMHADSLEIGKLVDEVAELYPDNYDINTVAYDFYNKTGQTGKSYPVIKKLIALKKDNYLIWQQALFSASRLGKYDDMVQFGEEGLKYFPNKPLLHLFTGIGWYQKNNYDKALKILSEGYKESLEKPVKEQFLNFMGEAEYKAGNYKNAFDYFEELLSLEPTNNLVKNNYSYYLAIAGTNLERARKLSQETLKEEPSNSTYLDTFGWILYKSGDYTEARIYLEKALENTKDNSEILFHYAEVLYQLGDRDTALSYYKKARDNGLESDDVRKRIEELQHD